MAFADALIQCSPYRRRLDSPTVTVHGNLAATQPGGAGGETTTLPPPPIEDFPLDERDFGPADFTGSDPGAQSRWKARLGGKRASAERGKPGQCKVCGDLATGMYFGALVCVPCKTFFLRYEGDSFNFVCKGNKDCEITVATRTQCKFCRYQKCREAGMVRRVRPAHVNLNEGQQLCVVCHDVANGIHFGAVTCEGCKKFFRRGLSEHTQYSCKNGQMCVINPRTRNSCRFCRYKTCLRVGMSREAIQMGRPSKLALEGSVMQRGVRTTGGGSGPGHDEMNRPTETSAGNVKDIMTHYLVGNHHPKDEPPTWDWQADVGHAALQGPGNFAGHGSGVCDFLESSGKNIGIEKYSSQYPSGGLSTTVRGSNGIDQISGNSAVHYGSSNADVSMHDAVQSLVLSALYHNSGCTVHQTNAVPSYEQHATIDGQELISSHALSGIYLDKTNIPCTVIGSIVASDTLQFPAGADDVHQSLKFGDFESSLESKLDHFDLPRSLLTDPIGHKMGQMQNYGDVLESLLDDSYQSQEPAGICSAQDQFTSKFDSEVNNFLGMTSDQQSKKVMDLGGTDGEGVFENLRSANNGGKVHSSPSAATTPRSEQLNRTSCFQTTNASGSSATLTVQSQQGSMGYAHFGMLPSFDPNVSSKMEPYSTHQGGPEESVSPASVRSVRDDTAAVRNITVLDEAKNNVDSIAEWVFQLQQSYVDNNEEETPAVFLSDGLVKVCRDLFIDGVPFEQQIESSIQYWKSQELPDENIMVGAEHWRLFNHFHPLYANYVSMGGTWNHNLRLKFEQWKAFKVDVSDEEIAVWVKENVFPAYTDLSHRYFFQIQGFKSFDVHDQVILLRLAQSQSRILAAALAWFNSDSQTFTDFLPWRELKPGQVDLFQELLTDYAKNVQNRNLDPVESALFNIVVVIATDYPGLVKPDIIESYRTQFLATFRAYTTAKYGTPNKRMEKLFHLVPQLRRLGHLHYAMTQDPNIGITSNSA